MIRRVWTPKEVAYLRAKYGEVPFASICRKLKRTDSSVRSKADQLDLTIRDADALTMNETCEVLGVTPRFAARWIRNGFLVARYSRRQWFVSSAAIETFLEHYPWEVDRDRVDEAYRQFVSERYVTLPEAFERGAGHCLSLMHAAHAGLLPEVRKRSTFWVVPERTIPALKEARRTQVSDYRHRKAWLEYAAKQAAGAERDRRLRDNRAAAKRARRKTKLIMQQARQKAA